MCAYLNSSEFEARADLMRKFGSDASKTRVIEPNSYFNRLLNKQFDMDREDVSALTSSRDAYLARAIDCYLKCLKYTTNGNKIDNTCVFRFVSLWTENSFQVRSGQIKKKSFLVVFLFKPAYLHLRMKT